MLQSSLRDTVKCKFDNFRFPFDRALCQVQLTFEAMRSRTVSNEEFCLTILRPHIEIDVPYKNLSQCMEINLESYNALKQSNLMDEPVGWRVLPGINDSVPPMEAMSFAFDSNGYLGTIYFRLQRKSFTHVMVWIVTPNAITLVSVLGITLLW